MERINPRDWHACPFVPCNLYQVYFMCQGTLTFSWSVITASHKCTCSCQGLYIPVKVIASQMKSVKMKWPNHHLLTPTWSLTKWTPSPARRQHSWITSHIRYDTSADDTKAPYILGKKVVKRRQCSSCHAAGSSRLIWRQSHPAVYTSFCLPLFISIENPIRWWSQLWKRVRREPYWSGRWAKWCDTVPIKDTSGVPTDLQQKRLPRNGVCRPGFISGQNSVRFGYCRVNFS